jgi:deoxycytidylate deaminase
MDGARHVIGLHRGRYAVQSVRGGYVVLDPEGRIVAKGFGDHDRAVAKCARLQREADTVAKRGERPCISCAKPFDSEGIHNRMCPTCRARSSDGWNPHGIAPRSGRPR